MASEWRLVAADDGDPEFAAEPLDGAAGLGSLDGIPPESIELDAVAEQEPDPAVPAGVRNDARLIAVGVLAGGYLLTTLAWFGQARAYSRFVTETVGSSGALGDVLLQALIWWTVCAPALWFATAYSSARVRGVRLRLRWLVLGLVLLFPLSLVIGSVA